MNILLDGELKGSVGVEDSVAQPDGERGRDKGVLLVSGHGLQVIDLLEVFGAPDQAHKPAGTVHVKRN